MKKLCLYLIFLFPILITNAQEKSQDINYEIDVTLTPSSHRLTGTIKIDYIHRGKSPLDTIFLYLYPNAYEKSLTAFGKQQLRNKKTDFYFANDSLRGSISGFHFQSKERPLPLLFTVDKDIAYLLLEESLSPGENITLSSPFSVKIPALYSRLGYQNSIYQITQWFPKIAKYTSKGWVKYPYLDMGEFYSDFADYTVEITLPSDYIVAATGELKSEKERKWYHNLTQDSSSSVPYDSEYKTLLFEAENVQDFAWFTSKSFLIDHKTTTINEKTVDCWVFHQYPHDTIWDKALHFNERALQTFSEWIGPYQYPQMTIVGAYLRSGAGMEYPMISLIAESSTMKTLDRVIAHEVAHNWFYGMIGIDERQYPFLDEGLTTQNDWRYIEKFYKEKEKFIPNDRYPYSIEQYYYWNNVNRNYNLNVKENLSDQSEFRYYLNNYQFAPRAYEYLRTYVGDSTWNRTMQALYDKYIFKYLDPYRFQLHLEEHLNIPTDWLFTDYLNGDKLFSYSIKKVNETQDTLNVILANNSGLQAPIILHQYKDDSIVWEGKYPAFANEKSFSIPLVSEADSLGLYTASLFIDYRSKRGYTINREKIVDKRLSFRFLTGYEPAETNSVFYAPIIGYNVYDGLMLGAVFHNITIPGHKPEFQFLPYYGFNSQDFAGILNMHYDIYSKGRNLNRLRISLNSRRFHYDSDEHYGYKNSYIKVAPALNYRWKQSPTTYNTTDIDLRAVYINQKKGIGEDYEAKEFYYDRGSYTVLEGRITHENRHPITPYSASLTGQFSAGKWRTSLELSSSYKFAPQFRVGGRVFAGLSSSGGNSFPSLQFFTTGTPAFSSMDYMRDAFLLDRTAEEGILAQQVFDRDIGMPLPVVFPLGSEVVGGDFYLKYNMGFIAVKPYYYWSYTGSDATITPFTSTFGSTITLAYDIIEINFPFYTTDAIVEAMELQGHDSYWEKITYSIDFGRLLPDKLLRDLFSVD